MALSDRLHKTHSDIDVDCALCRREAASLGMGHLLPDPALGVDYLIATRAERRAAEERRNRPAWVRRGMGKDLTGQLR